MNNESHEPLIHAIPPTPLEPDSPALAPHLDDSFFETRRLREGGWDGPKMATFIGTLAESGVVTFACRACDMSAKSAYALRHRDPLFARAWDAALDMARQRLADELLARSLKGSVEQLLREGCIVGERHAFDNKLAFSILRRLDRRAELGSTFSTPPAWERPTRAPAVAGRWQDLLDALTDGRTDEAGRLLAVEDEQGNSQGNDPPFEDDDSDSLDDDEPETRDRVWHDWQSDDWRTDFPPPRGFDGDEYGSWDDPQGYSRTLADDELAALAAAGIIDPIPDPVSIEDDEKERDAFFQNLTSSLPRSGGEGDHSIAE